MTTRGSWCRVSAKSPCPICKRPDYCAVTADGTVAKCMRVGEGAFKTMHDRNGADYHLHRLADGPRPAAAAPPQPAAAGARAGAELLHAVYSALLALLSLSAPHRGNLRGRGLKDEEIDRRGYRTLPVQGRARLAARLRERFGDKLLAVPGLVVKQGEKGPYTTIAGAAGLLVPVRDIRGRVVALMVRRDDAGKGGKYSYLSSAKYGGPSPGAPVHAPQGAYELGDSAADGPAARAVVRVTEGALKADIAQALSGVPTLGMPGVSSWRLALDALQVLGGDWRPVHVALDMDQRDNPAVARALAALVGGLAAAGRTVALEQWDPAHKGIDDALAAGAAVEVLYGDAMRRAVRDAVTEATAGEPAQEAPALDRLDDVLAEGVEAFYRDGELLAALARLAETDPAEYACRRAQLQGAGVKLRDLDRALAPLRQEVRRERPAPDAAGCYRISAGRIVRDVLTKDGPVEVPLANWSGRIVEEVVHDDGTERRILFAVEGSLSDGTTLPRAEVPADQFPFMRWPVASWGTRAVVLAGASTADHVRAALQLLSGDAPRRVVFGHTGWREVNGEWVYLHGDGAIGKEGPAAGVAVSLPDALAGFRLPDPPAGTALTRAVRASLGMLDGLAPDRIVVPLLAAVYRAVLGPADFAGHLSGPTGNFKTELAALGQQHHGAAMDARNLPGSWSSTGNALEGVAFAAKDALVVVDDFAPTGSASDVQRFHREADRLLRAQGNRSGRQRMRPDGTLRPARPPRGLILSTGEDVPRGQSLRSRLFVIEVSPGDVRAVRLTECQRDAAAGLYAQALAGFVRWLAARYETLRGGLRQEAAGLRDEARAERQHARTPGIVADLAVGMRCLLDFALDAGAVTAAQREALARRCGAALNEAAVAQATHVEGAEPTALFLRLLTAVLASGRAHVAGADGEQPPEPRAWGWRPAAGADSLKAWVPQGRRVGWVEDEALYLEPEAAFAEAQELSRTQGDSLPVSPRTLWRRLRERGLLAGWDAGRQRNTVRRTLGGVKDRDVLHLRVDALSTCTAPSEPSAGPPDTQETGEWRTVTADGPLDAKGICRDDHPPEPSAEQAENAAGGRFGQSAVGVEAPTGPKPPPPNGTPRRGVI